MLSVFLRLRLSYENKIKFFKRLSRSCIVMPCASSMNKTTPNVIMRKMSRSASAAGRLRASAIVFIFRRAEKFQNRIFGVRIEFRPLKACRAFESPIQEMTARREPIEKAKAMTGAIAATTILSVRSLVRLTGRIKNCREKSLTF